VSSSNSNAKFKYLCHTEPFDCTQDRLVEAQIQIGLNCDRPRRLYEAFFDRSNLLKLTRKPVKQLIEIYYNSTDRFVVPPRKDIIFES